jgi:hypothetical protein
MLLVKTLLVATTLGAIGLAAPTATEGPQTPQLPRTLRLTAETTQSRAVDLPPSHHSLGDEEITSGTLVDDQGTAAGSYGADCSLVAVYPDHALEHCTGFGSLAGGQLTFAGSSRSDLEHGTLAITGGTGVYQGARGQIQLQETGNNRTLVTVHLLDAAR